MGAVFDRMTIKQKIMALVSLVFVLTTLILSVAFDRIIVRHEISSMEEEATLLSMQADNAAAVYLQVLKEDLVNLSRAPELRQGGNLTVYLNHPSAVNGRVEMDPEVMQGYELNVFNTFLRFANAHGVKAGQISYAMTDGGYLQFPAVNKENTFDPRKLEWYQQAMAQPGKVLVSKPFHSPRATPSISAYVTVMNWDNHPIGVLAMDMDLSALHELTGKLSLGNLGYLMLLDGDSTILADPKHPDTAFRKLEEAQLGDLSTIGPRTSGMRKVMLDNEEHYVNVYTSKTTGLKYLAIIDESQLTGGVNHLRLILFLVLLAALFGGLAGAWWLTNKITAPLRRLEERADSIASGDLQTAEDVMESDDEIGRLSSAFQDMGSQLRQQLREVQEGAGKVADSATALAQNVENCQRTAQEVRQTSDQSLITLKDQSRQLEAVSRALHNFQADCSTAPAEIMPAINDSTDVPLQKLQELMGTTSASLAQGKETAQSLREAVKELRLLCESAGAPSENLRMSFQKIKDVINLITSISEQTNLLALNAAVESVRYNGKAKSKFTAVAEEIRKLSEQAGESSQQGAKLLENILADIAAMTENWKNGHASAMQGRKDIQKIEELLRDLSVQLQDQQEALREGQKAIVATQQPTAAPAGNILTESQQQAIATIEETSRTLQTGLEALQNQLNNAGQALDQQQNSLDAITTSSKTLARQAGELREGIGQFRI